MDQVIKDIITRFLQHRVTSEEMYILDEWMKDREHRVMFKTFVREWEKTSGCFKFFSAEQAWDNFIFKRHRYRLWKHYFRYAAIVCCMVGGTVLWMLRGETNHVASVESALSELKPLGYHAVLTLQDGEKIELQETDSLNLLQLEKMNIPKIKESLYNQDLEDSSLYHSLWVPAGAEFQLTLEDGTKVWLNNQTIFQYPVKFMGNMRQVYLDGEAYFEVSRDEHHPFCVVTPNAKLNVLGTSFNVNTKDIEEAVTLVSGSLSVSTGQCQVVLDPGKQAIVKENSLIKVREVDTLIYTSWLKGLFYFSNETLENVMKRLSEWYRFDYCFEQESLKSERIMCIVNKYDDFEKIMQLFEDGQIVHIEYDQGKVLVKPFIK